MDMCSLSLRLASALVAGAFALAFVGGCSSAPAGGGGGPKLADRAAIVAEYDAAISDMKFPSGVTPKLPSRPLEGAGAFEVGYGVSLAGFQYQCAWEREWLAERSQSPAGAEAALTALQGIFDDPFMQEASVDKSVVKHVRDILDRARLGDASGIQEEVDSACTGY